MSAHASELIEFFDQHWCSVMTASADPKTLHETAGAAMNALQDLRKEFLQELYQVSPE